MTRVPDAWNSIPLLALCAVRGALHFWGVNILVCVCACVCVCVCVCVCPLNVRIGQQGYKLILLSVCMLKMLRILWGIQICMQTRKGSFHP